MNTSSAVRLARVLKVLITAVFICNLITLALVPGLSLMRTPEELLHLTPYENLLELPLRLAVCFLFAWRWAWEAGSYSTVLTVFLLFCGSCTAVLLWQGRRVLTTLAAAKPFRRENAENLRRAAVCCFLIAAASLVRVLRGFWFYQSIRPLLTYNALFFPIFLMGGLLCMVLSALFRQAADLKEENDLTI